ncbi:MAG TPA: ABC transporter permease [Thermomicrobiales bacterium]|jgi:peptide/nickel transport system permease protein|nr:ABC transporter permease [Thermomicrobiales bacterium]
MTLSAPATGSRSGGMVTPVGEPAVMLRRPRSWRQTGLTPGGALGLALVAVLVIVAVLGPWLTPHDPARQSLGDRLQPPVWSGGSWDRPLGTDGLGRDLLSRVIDGARVSLLVGVTATLVAGTIGVTLGLLAGGLGRRWDRAVSWLVSVELAIPSILIGLGIAAALGTSLRNVIIVLVITGWVAYARIVRLQARALWSAAWMDAARAMGAPPGRLLVRHLLPNLAGPVIVVASQQVAAMILYEASLSFLGLGVPLETITWGGMMNAGREQLATAWWVSTIPGIALALTVLAFNLTGDWLAERLR